MKQKDCPICYPKKVSDVRGWEEEVRSGCLCTEKALKHASFACSYDKEALIAFIRKVEREARESMKEDALMALDSVNLTAVNKRIVPVIIDFYQDVVDSTKVKIRAAINNIEV